MTNSEPVEAEAENENAVAPRGTHLASTQTVTHEYLTQSGKVMRETVTTNQTVTAVMDFVYDESGKPFALEYSSNGGRNFVTYYYVLNLQGDVVKLIDGSGAEAAAYAYDAWGNLLSATGSMADLNPLRYRGYYYDSETGFYYLQSRYYDPATRRFINADALASTGQGFIGTNMFAYCNNSPVAFKDVLGSDAILIIDEDAVNGNGHVCLLVQNGDEEWDYYSFASGVSNFALCVSIVFGAFTNGNVPGRLYRSELGPADGDVSTLADCKALMGKDKNTDAPYAYNASKKMDYAIYIKGDFSESYKYAKLIYKGQEKGEMIYYNLFSQNCMHAAIGILAQSPDAFTESQYEIIAELRLYSFIPNNNIKLMEKLGAFMK